MRLKLEAAQREAKQALGKLNAPAAWFLLADKVAQALEGQPDQSQQLAEEMYLFDQPDDPLQLHDFEDLLEVIVGMNPVRGINHFHYINPEFSLKRESLEKVNALKTLEAVLGIFTVSDRWAAELSRPPPPETLDLTQEGEHNAREQEDSGVYATYSCQPRRESLPAAIPPSLIAYTCGDHPQFQQN